MQHQDSKEKVGVKSKESRIMFKALVWKQLVFESHCPERMS